MKEQPCHELPFIIGISGHRDVASLAEQPQLGVEGVKLAIKESLSFWRQQLGEHTPIWLVTGMAEGADLLAIEAVEALITEGWQAQYLKVIPCLAMPQAAFEIDFSCNALLTKFKGYMQRYAENAITLPSALPDGRYQAALIDSSYGSDRNSLYMNLAGFLARACNVIVCVWDGLDGNGSGGTADVVKLKLGMEVSWPIEQEFISKALQQPESLDRHFGGIIHHISVNRHTPSPQPSIVNRLLATLSDLAHSDYRLYVSSAFANEKQSICQRDQSQEFRVLVDQLYAYNNDAQPKLDKQQAVYPHTSLVEANPIFQQADGIAQKFQSIYRNRIKCFFGFSFVGLAVYELIGSYLGQLTGAVLNVVILLAVICCWYLIKNAKKQQWKWKYQIARGIAESLRTRGFLNLANIAPDNHPLLPRRYKNTFPIFEQAIMIAEMEWWKYPLARDVQRVKKEWLQDQRGFLAKRLISSESFSSLSTIVFKRPKIALHYLTCIAKTLFISATLLGAMLLLLQANIYVDSVHWLTPAVTSWLMIFIQYLLMLAAASALWIELASYRSTASGYENLLQLYELALTNIESKNSQLINVTLRTLAKEALLEHCEWSHYESQSDIQTKN